MFSKNKLFKSLSTCAAFSILGTNFLQAQGPSLSAGRSKSSASHSRSVVKKGRSNEKVKSNNGVPQKVKNQKGVAKNKTFNLNKIINDVRKFVGHLDFNKIVNDIYKFASSPLVYPSLLTLPPVLLAILLSPEGNNDKNAKKVQNNPSKNKPTGKPSSPSNKNSSGKTGGAPQEHLSPIVYDEWSEEDRDFFVGCVIIFLIAVTILYLIFKPNNLYSKSKLDKEKIVFFDEKTGKFTNTSDLEKSQGKGKSINLLNTMCNRGDIGYLNKEEQYFRVGNEIIYLDEQKELYEKLAHLNKTSGENNTKNIKKKEKKLKKKGGPRNVYDVLPVLPWANSNCSVLSAFYLMYSPEYKVLYDILRFLDKEVLLECLKIILNNKSLKMKKPFLFSRDENGGESSFEEFQKLGEDKQKMLLEFYAKKKLCHLKEFPEFKEGEGTVEMENRVIGNFEVRGNDGTFIEKKGFGSTRGFKCIHAVDTLKCFGFEISGMSGDFKDNFHVEGLEDIPVGEFFTNSKILNFYWGTTTKLPFLGEKKEENYFVIKQFDRAKGDESTIYLKLPENNFIDGPLPTTGYSSIVKENWKLGDLVKECPAEKLDEGELFKIFIENEQEYHRKDLAKKKKNKPEQWKNYDEKKYIEEQVENRRKKFTDDDVKGYIKQGYLPLGLAKKLVREKISKEKNIKLSDEEYEKMWSDDTMFRLIPLYSGNDCIPLLGKTVSYQVKKDRSEIGFSAGYREKKIYIAAISVYGGVSAGGHWYCLQPKYKWDSDREEYVISRWVKLSCLNRGHELLNKNQAEKFLRENLSYGNREALKNVPMRVITQEEIEACPGYYIMDEKGNMGKEKDIRPGALEKNKGGYIPEEWQDAFKQVCEKYKNNGETLSGNKKENESDVNNGNNEFDINTNIS